MKELTLKVIEDKKMIELGTILTSFAYPDLVIALTGDLGAGKTTFTKGIGLALGIKRVINSPTFTIMKIYAATNKINGIEKLYHLDVYRVTSSSDDFELSEYFEMNGLTVIEWADIIEDLLPEKLWRMQIKNIDENSRLVKIIFNDDTNVGELEKVLEEKNYEVIHG